jgi:dienelactone hydrolase
MPARPAASTGAIAASALAAAALMLAASAGAQDDAALPERVTFPSADGHTTLVGYVYTPRGAGGTRVPAVVMMHGRSGAYSIRANGRYDASTLSKRHRMWGRFWAAQGYVAIMVDGFGPRGYPHGFPRFSYKQRPADVDEVTVRPLDAYGALAYLRTRTDVAADRIGLQGWSNGGSAALATMAADSPGLPGRVGGFRAALAFYPGCGLKKHFTDGLKPYAPVRVYHGTADEETSPWRCQQLVERSRGKGGDIAFVPYPGATHGFDDPSDKRQSVASNASAKADATAQAQKFFAERLGGRAAR